MQMNVNLRVYKYVKSLNTGLYPMLCFKIIFREKYRIRISGKFLWISGKF